MKKIFNIVATTAILGTPFLAFAAKDFKWLVSSIITDFIKPTTWLIMSLAVAFFLWNMMEVVRNSDNPDELAKFKGKAVWGIVAIAVMISMWGLVNFVTGSLDLDTTTPVTIPSLNDTGSTGGVGTDDND